MQVSHSKVECFNQCSYKYKLRYVDKLKTYPNNDPANPLIVGTALHTGIEKDVSTAVAEYYNSFPVITDQHIEEVIKLEAIIPKCKAVLPQGEYERMIVCSDFIGFMDLLVPVSEGVYDLYDFKYSNSVDTYLKSGQLHEYKYYFERTTGKQIRKMYFMFAPKVSIRMKKTENLDTFRRRLREELANKEPQLVEVKYDIEKVKDFLRNANRCRMATKFEKTPSKLCDWCEYQNYCFNGDDLDIMNLPKNERRTGQNASYKKIWFYGLPFSGKTYLANKFPDVLMLNTDGNVKYVDAPCIPIRDEITVDGRITRRKYAWEVFKEAITELEKKDNTFETIVVDLVEDTYEHCRLWCYNHLGIEHESDNSFKAWDFVRTEFLATIKRLMNLDYNIVLISHEDSSKDITKKTGDKITAIKPNVNDKVALKIAGMVDIVGRILNDEGHRTISFKSNEVIFGGGRLELKALDIPCDYDELMKVYAGIAAPKKRETPKPVEKPVEARYFKKCKDGTVFILPEGANFADIGEDPSECEEITKEEYEKTLNEEAEVKPTPAPVETATATPTETPRRTRRVRNTQ